MTGWDDQLGSFLEHPQGPVRPDSPEDSAPQKRKKGVFTEPRALSLWSEPCLLALGFHLGSPRVAAAGQTEASVLFPPRGVSGESMGDRGMGAQDLS